jgi:hypothetical protein
MLKPRKMRLAAHIAQMGEEEEEEDEHEEEEEEEEEENACRIFLEKYQKERGH